MKIEQRTITIQIDIEEWNKVYKEWSELSYSLPYEDLKKRKNLIDFLISIESVNSNPSWKIDRKINTYQ